MGDLIFGLQGPDGGSTTVRSRRFDDLYFSAEDGLAEARHVYLRGNRLPEAWEDRPDFVVAELGFGTGLNFIALRELWHRRAAGGSLTYYALEKYPLESDALGRALSLACRAAPELRGFQEELLSCYDPAGGVWDWAGIRLVLLIGDAGQEIRRIGQPVDAWFLDGFSPAKNPEMWSPPLMEALASRTSGGGTLASFTAAGAVKRALREAGFEIVRRPGHGSKRHMITGFKSAQPEKPDNERP